MFGKGVKALSEPSPKSSGGNNRILFSTNFYDYFVFFFFFLQSHFSNHIGARASTSFISHSTNTIVRIFHVLILLFCTRENPKRREKTTYNLFQFKSIESRGCKQIKYNNTKPIHCSTSFLLALALYLFFDCY